MRSRWGLRGVNRAAAAAVLAVGFFLPVFSAAAEPTLAVSPFNNISGQEDLDYIGFQVSEYLTTAYSSFSNITLVERSSLVDILKEQELQLSGITDSGKAVEVGQILNARYMVLGSYSVNGNTLRVSARVTDVQDGEVISAEAVQGRQDRLFPMLKQLFFKLVAGMKGSGSGDFSDWEITVPVEARVASMEDQGEEASQQFAKALEASFRENEEEALSLLQDTISGSQMNYTSYAGAADEYLETYKRVQKIESDTFYTRMLKRQIDTNKQLLAEAEKATLYRNTLKILYRRMREALQPSMFTLEVGTDYQFEEGSVSMKIAPPSDLSIRAKPALEQTVRQLIGQQDILTWGAGDSLSFSRLPQLEKLMTPEGMESLFDFSLHVEMDYAVQFLSPEGDVIYELVPGAPAVPFSVGEGKLKWRADPAEVYSEAYPRDGWSYRDGKVEVQARELKNLANVRVVLKPESFGAGGAFLMEQDRVWKSLVMHAYRQQYVKITGGEEDSCPQVKEAVVTDHMLNFPGYAVDRVPLLAEKRPLARFADLTGVVYWADSSHTLVEGHWSGAIHGQSETVRGELTPQSVLYFPLDSSPTDFRNMTVEPAVFTVKNEGKAKTVEFRVGSGMTFFQDEDGPYQLLLTEDGLFGTGSEGTFRYDPKTGEILWKSQKEGEDLVYDGRRLFVTDGSRGEGTACLDPEDGEILWNKKDIPADTLTEGGNHIFAAESSTYCLDKGAGTLLWKTGHDASALVIAGDRLSNGDVLLNRVTGEEEKDLGYHYRNNPADVVSGEGRLYVTGREGTMAWDSRTMEKLWESDRDGYALALEGDRLYVTDGRYGTACLEAESGKVLWHNDDADGGALAVMGGTVFTAGGDLFALSALGGKILWQGNYDADDVAAGEGLVYYTHNRGDFWALDPGYFYRDEPDAPAPFTAQSRGEVLRPGGGVNGVIEPGGAEWFRLEVSEGDAPSELTLYTLTQDDLSTEFTVYTETGRRLVESGRPGRNRNEDWDQALRLGIFREETFFVKVEGDYSDSAGPFRLKAQPRSIQADRYEPDYLPALAKGYTGQPQRHLFSTTYDYDWVVFEVDSEQSYRITAELDSEDFSFYGSLYETDVSLETARSFPESFEHDDLPGWDEVRTRADRSSGKLMMQAQLTPGKAYYLRIRPRIYRSTDPKDVEGTAYRLSIEPLN